MVKRPLLLIMIMIELYYSNNTPYMEWVKVVRTRRKMG